MMIKYLEVYIHIIYEDFKKMRESWKKVVGQLKIDINLRYRLILFRKNDEKVLSFGLILTIPDGSLSSKH